MLTQTIIGRYFRRFAYRVKKLFQFLKLGWYDCDWDYAYLLEMEQDKLRAMADVFEKENFFEGCQFVVRDMRICISLLDIVMGKTHCYNSFFPKNEDFLTKTETSSKRKFKINVDKLKYVRTHNVNIKNVGRFMDKDTIRVLFNKDASENIHFFGEDELRQRKAWALYCQIRKEHLFEWWY